MQVGGVGLETPVSGRGTGQYPMDPGQVFPVSEKSGQPGRYCPTPASPAEDLGPARASHKEPSNPTCQTPLESGHKDSWIELSRKEAGPDKRERRTENGIRRVPDCSAPVHPEGPKSSAQVQYTH